MILFPAPAAIGEGISGHTDRTGGEMRTITTNPQEGTILLPFPECAPLDKPRRSATMLDFACSVMIDGRVWRGEP